MPIWKIVSSQWNKKKYWKEYKELLGRNSSSKGKTGIGGRLVYINIYIRNSEVLGRWLSLLTLIHLIV